MLFLQSLDKRDYINREWEGIDGLDKTVVETSEADFTVDHEAIENRKV
jgi:hypothetical protein